MSDFLLIFLLPLVNAVAYLGGACVAVWRLIGHPQVTWSRWSQAAYVAFTSVWVWIGGGYLLFVLGVLDQSGLTTMNRPIVWATSLPAWFGWYLIDRDRERAAARYQWELEFLNSRLDELSDG